ncbi:hypothetical protein [Desulfobotulus sp.]|uniref:hypothetical protein n=1 Tax=Desulfobotulus sp. TaxID=1940337 RepID=UPI002A36DADF|nr:hypothetical protein [Desulfobotulus sp.]MDY0164296.1 hypothetical protein [Desulfobotulus sp.]
MDIVALEPGTLIALAVIGLGYGLASDVIGESRLPDGSVAGLVFRLGRKLGSAIRKKMGGR